MDSFELNKIAGAVLGTLLFIVAVNLLSGFLFESEKPEVAGYELPEPAANSASDPKAAVAPTVPLPELLAKADAKKGEASAKKCTACHNFEKGGPNKVGPNLWGVVERPKGSIAGFGYSAALKERAAKGESWSYDHLNGFLTNPKGYIPGTAMAFAGIAKPEERADVIAYLRTLNDSPKPLP